VIASQVSNGISVRMGLLYLLLGGPPVPGVELPAGHDERAGRLRVDTLEVGRGA
jgi:hypothetical protein